MAFAAVLTALGYYIILRRFCQGLLKIFLQGAATGGKFSPFAACQPRLWLTSLPFPRRGWLRQVEQARRGDSSPAGDSGGRASNAGASPPLGTCLVGSVSAASGSVPGMQGAEPLA